MKTGLAQRQERQDVTSRPAGGGPRLVILTIDARFLMTHRLPVALAARNEGYDVHIAAPVDPASKRGDAAAEATIREHGLAFHRIPLRRSSTNPREELRLIRALRALFTTLRPDLVHCVGLKPVLYGGALARIMKMPAVHAITGLGHAFMGQDLKALARRRLVMAGLRFALKSPKASAIFQNPDDRALFARAGLVDERRTFMLRGTGADLGVFRPRAESEITPADPPVVMLASRLIRSKGIPEFVAAAEALKQAGVAGRFVLVGETDPENPTCVSDAELARWQADGLVEWWGHSDDMPATLRQADVFCLPSWYREGIPRVLIEAAASGLPLVTTDMPGCREVVRQGHNGLLVPPRDAQALQLALAKLLADPAMRQGFGERSREIAEAEFSLDAFLTASLAVYRAARAPAPAAAS